MERGYEEHMVRRRAEIADRMRAALAASGRREDDARLLAVSKTVGVDEVVAAMHAGYGLFGENRPQELVRKLDALGERDDVDQGAYRFDMIGNLQTNKINMVLGRAALIHSVRSLTLARGVSDRVLRAAAASAVPAVPQPVLFEVNVSGEESKSGFSPAELLRDLEELAGLPGIEPRGLMTMAPRGDEGTARRTFSGLRELRDVCREACPDMALEELSMGMSEDFEAALMEGSTLIRLGRVVFDPAFVL